MKIVVLVGPPCSGKSTWAKKFIKDKPDWIRLNKDDYRNMLSGGHYKFNNKAETLVHKLQRESLTAALSFEYNVVVDNTHCQVRDIRTYIDEYKHTAHQVSFKTFIEPLDKLRDLNIVRCSQDGTFIPVEVLRRMHENYHALVKEVDMSQYEFKEEAA